jgi:type IV secretory pathway TrbD component
VGSAVAGRVRERAARARGNNQAAFATTNTAMAAIRIHRSRWEPGAVGGAAGAVTLSSGACAVCVPPSVSTVTVIEVGAGSGIAKVSW